VPPGYHVEERPRVGLTIAGGTITAAGLGFLIYGMAERAEEKRRYRELSANDPSYEGDAGGAGILMMMGGVITAVGVPLLVVGLTTKKSVLVRNDNVAIAPVVTPSFGGLALSATF
jgi:hypothetical protein